MLRSITLNYNHYKVSKLVKSDNMLATKVIFCIITINCFEYSGSGAGAGLCWTMREAGKGAAGSGSYFNVLPLFTQFVLHSVSTDCTTQCALCTACCCENKNWKAFVSLEWYQFATPQWIILPHQRSRTWHRAVALRSGIKLIWISLIIQHRWFWLKPLWESLDCIHCFLLVVIKFNWTKDSSDSCEIYATILQIIIALYTWWNPWNHGNASFKIEVHYC